MKRNKLPIIVLCALLTCSGCTKSFDELSINPKVLSANQFYKNEDDALKAVYGMYSYLATPRNLGAHGKGVLILRGDESTSTSDYGTSGQYGDLYTPNYYQVQEPWALMYTVAFAATNILSNVPNIAFKDEELKKAYLGEAYFMRAFAHFYLLINYRNIPLLVEPAKSPLDFVRGQAPPDQVWDQIISDLKLAKENLPSKGYWQGEDVGRVTKGSAAALLGKAYLYRSGIEMHYGNGASNYYNEAAAEFSEIIDGSYGSYKLMEDYSDNFNIENENNDESLFEIQFKGDIQHDGFNPGLLESGVFIDHRGFAPPGYAGTTGECVLNNWLYDAFVASKDINGHTDIRMFGTMIFDDSAPEISVPDSDNDGIPDYKVTGVAGMSWKEMYPNGMGAKRPWAEPFKATNRKWIDLTLPVDGEARFNNARAQGSNYRYIRYADVLLMYAEAVLMGGIPQSSLTALDAVNLVRARAHMPALSTLNMDDIERERILELSMEGHRFYDLLRWGKVAERHEFLFATDPNFKKAGYGRGANEKGFVRNKHEWMPIPLSEVESNPEVHQNPGW